jgi:hypothetical protein
LPQGTKNISHYYKTDVVQTGAQQANYFRIKEQNFNGNFSYSRVVYVACSNHGLEIYPTAGNDLVNVKCSEGIETIRLFDITGKLIKDETTHNLKAYSFDISQYAQGSYVIEIKTVSGSILNRKLIRY